MFRRWGSAIALNTSEVVAARAMTTSYSYMVMCAMLSWMGCRHFVAQQVVPEVLRFAGGTVRRSSVRNRPMTLVMKFS